METSMRFLMYRTAEEDEQVVISKMETTTPHAFNRTQPIVSDFDRAVAKLIEGQDGGVEG